MQPFLRDRPTREMEGQIDALTRALASAQAEERARLLGMRGDLLRVVGRLGEARADLEQALASAVAVGDGEAEARGRIRLGTALFYAGDHTAAEPELRRAVEDARELGNEKLLSFAHQHLGKCLAETERYTEARRHISEALALRTGLEDDALAASSQQALDGLPGEG